MGLTYFQDDLNPKFGQFFEQAGFKAAAMKGIEVASSDVDKVPSEQIDAKAKKLFQYSGSCLDIDSAEKPFTCFIFSLV